MSVDTQTNLSGLSPRSAAAKKARKAFMTANPNRTELWYKGLHDAYVVFNSLERLGGIGALARRDHWTEAQVHGALDELARLGDKLHTAEAELRKVIDDER
jgi:hypothetical protein